MDHRARTLLTAVCLFVLFHAGACFAWGTLAPGWTLAIVQAVVALYIAWELHRA